MTLIRKETHPMVNGQRPWVRGPGFSEEEEGTPKRQEGLASPIRMEEG